MYNVHNIINLNLFVGEVMKFYYALSGGHVLIYTVRLCRGERPAKKKKEKKNTGMKVVAVRCCTWS